MKKKHLLLAIASLATTCSFFAQPILTAANSNPVSGETFTGESINYTSPGSGGANQTWNFSALVSQGSSSFSFMNAAATPNAASFPNAALATFSSANTSYDYFSASASALSIEGYAYGPPSNLIIPYSDPQLVLSYPFTMGSTFTDPYSGTYTSGTSTIIRKGTSTVTADGYGTLILPYGTLNNVLRTVLIDDYADTTSLGVPYAKYTITAYNWYVPGVHYQVLGLTTLTSNGGPVLAQFGTYLDQASTGIAVNGERESFVIYPNPASDQLFIKTDEKMESITCINYSGQLMEVSFANNKADISALPGGIYFLVCHTQNGGVIKRKFSKL